MAKNQTETRSKFNGPVRLFEFGSILLTPTPLMESLINVNICDLVRVERKDSSNNVVRQHWVWAEPASWLWWAGFLLCLLKLLFFVEKSWSPLFMFWTSANKFWSGLLEKYYLPRASMYFTRLLRSLNENEDFNLLEWRKEWIAYSNKWQARVDAYPVKAQGDALALAEELYHKYFM